MEEREKIKRFIADKSMASAVYNVLLQSFLEEQENKDVQTLAASWLAVERLKLGWKNLERYKQDETDKKLQDNVGL